MDNFEHLKRLANHNNDLKKHFQIFNSPLIELSQRINGLIEPYSEIINYSKNISQNLGINYLDGLTHKSGLKNPAFESILKITENHRKLFDNLYPKYLEDLKSYTKISNELRILGNFKTNFLLNNSRNEDYESLEDYEQLDSEITDLAVKAITSNEFSLEQQKKLDDIILALDQIKDRDKAFLPIILIIMSIISFFTSHHQYFDFLKPKAELSTKSDIKQLEAKVEKISYKPNINYRVATRTSNIMLRASDKSLCLGKLAKNSYVTIVAIHHKWACIVYIDKDNIPNIGWVKKKYLK